MGSQAVAAVVVVLLGPVLSLVGLWLRQRFVLRAERERRRYLLAAAGLPAGSRVCEQRGDGTRLVVTLGAHNPGGGGDE